MGIKKSSIVLAMMSAGGVPYMLSAPKLDLASGSSPAAQVAEVPVVNAPVMTPGPGQSIAPAAAHQATDPSTIGIRPLHEVLSFDRTPAWVLGNWPRVTTSLADLQTQGYRVPLVTGTREADLAGSLTYYFGNQRLERILFQGTTGDARQLVTLLGAQFGFSRELTDDPSVYLYRVRRGSRVVSELRIKPAPVIRKSEGNARFDVNLYLERAE
jgi:hypothetical protein